MDPSFDAPTKTHGTTDIQDWRATVPHHFDHEQLTRNLVGRDLQLADADGLARHATQPHGFIWPTDALTAR